MYYLHKFLEYVSIDEVPIPHKAHTDSVPIPLPQPPTTTSGSQYTSLTIPPTESLYDVPTFSTGIPPTLPIPLEELGTHVASCHTDNDASFNEQYKVLIFNMLNPFLLCAIGTVYW